MLSAVFTAAVLFAPDLGAQHGGALGLPLIYLVGRNGLIRAHFQRETDPAKILDALRPLLAH